ncbi:MAG: YegP family protein [Gammaproteobacteria bacterium]
MPASFELKTNENDHFYFNLLDSDGGLLMMSGEYPEKEAAEQAIKDVQVGSLMSDQIAAGQVDGGNTFFVIKDQAGDVLVKSILFNSRMLFDSALHTVKDNTCIAEVVDHT